MSKKKKDDRIWSCDRSGFDRGDFVKIKGSVQCHSLSWGYDLAKLNPKLNPKCHMNYLQLFVTENNNANYKTKNNRSPPVRVGELLIYSNFIDN